MSAACFSFRSWPRARVLQLRELWLTGKPPREIADLLGISDVMCVVAKLAREGLRRDYSVAAGEESIAEPVVTGPISLENVSGKHCRWIDGEVTYDALVCGKPAVTGSSWCREHHRRVYIRTERK